MKKLFYFFKSAFLKDKLTKKILAPFILLLLILSQYTCNTTEPPIIPPGDKVENTITLTVQWTDLYRINLKWNKAKEDTLVPFTYLLTQTDEQGNKSTKQFTITGKDTSYTAGELDSLQQGKVYKFFVEAYNEENKLKDTSKTVAGKTLTPTSNNIVWEIDTLGQAGNFLYDVWGLDENNVWAVGGVNLPEGASIIIKWNGNKWLPFTPYPLTANSIFGFAENDIWVVGGGTYGYSAHWNGSVWAEYSFYPPPIDTVWALHSVWGSSPDDVWAVGTLGTIIHWNGTEWKKENNVASSFGQYEFLDIWGFSENEIYATGRIYQDSVLLLKYDGTSWKEVLKRGSLVVYSTVWGAHNNLIYFIEYNNYLIVNNAITPFSLPGRQSGVERIRGSGSNNIFTVGSYGEAFHFNGIDWKRLSELYIYPNSRALTSCFTKEKTVFMVGLTPVGAIIIKGTIQ